MILSVPWHRQRKHMTVSRGLGSLNRNHTGIAASACLLCALQNMYGLTSSTENYQTQKQRQYITNPSCKLLIGASCETQGEYFPGPSKSSASDMQALDQADAELLSALQDLAAEDLIMHQPFLRSFGA